MKFNKRIVLLLSLIVFTSGAFAAVLTQSQSKELKLCNSELIECNVTLRGNGDGVEPPHFKKKKKV